MSAFLPQRFKNILKIFERSFLLLAVGLILILGISGCRHEESNFGSGQRASVKETAVQNEILLEQFVIAAEEIEKHPDTDYLENSISRLNPWLRACSESRDFQNVADYQEMGERFLQLSQKARGIDGLYQKAVPAASKEGKAEGEKITAESTLTGEEGDQLLTLLSEFSAAASEVNQDFHSGLLNEYIRFSNEMKSKIEEAGGFQFGDRGKMIATAIAKIQRPLFIDFKSLADHYEHFSQLFHLDSRSFFPEDAYYFTQSVWMRNVVGWAKGEDQETLKQVLNLFDWACQAIVLNDGLIQGPGGKIPQTPWQTMLTGLGTGKDRAVVFMGLLRQIGVTSFIVRPADLTEDRQAAFPLIVGVPFHRSTAGEESNVQIHLFLPEWGIPIPGPNAPILAGENEKEKGLQFSSVATLEEVAASDALLRRLDLPENPFSASASDFERVNLLLPTDCFSLSERMWIMMRESVIQKKENDGFGTESRSYVPPVLAVSMDSIEKEIGSLPHIAGIKQGWEFLTPVLDQACFPMESKLLLTPFQGEVIAGKNLSLSSSQDSSSNMSPAEGKSGNSAVREEEGERIHPLWEGKILYFKGQFSQENGAANRLQQGRVSDRILKQTSHSMNANLTGYLTQVQESYQKEGKNLSEQELQSIAMNIASQMQQDLGMKVFMKVAARYDLALVSLALGNKDAVAQHLQDRGLITEMNGLWKEGSLYLLARYYESIGDYERAEGIDKNLQGTMGQGAKLRAKWLRELTAVPGDGTSAAEGTNGEDHSENESNE